MFHFMKYLTTKIPNLLQFIKYLAVKAVQVVVQARLGERVTAPRFVKPDGYVLSFVNQNMI